MKQTLLQLRRREFMKLCATAAAASALPACSLLEASNAAAQVATAARRKSVQSPVDKVRPIIGTGWRGHVFPGAVAPFGLVQLSPDTSGPPDRRRGTARDNYEWNHCSGYHYQDNVVLGFSHTHLQGTGGIDLGDLRIMPVVEGRNWDWNSGSPGDQAEAQIDALGVNLGWVYSESVPGYRSFFSHEREVVRAGYYSVHLQTPNVQAELTATTRCAMHRYSFATLSQARKGVIVDLVEGVGGKVYHAELNIESASRISGKRYTHGWAADKQVYFVIEFSHPIDSVQMQVDGKVSSASSADRMSGEQIKAIFSHSPGSGPLILRVGLSCTSVEGATKIWLPKSRTGISTLWFARVRVAGMRRSPYWLPTFRMRRFARLSIRVLTMAWSRQRHSMM